MLGMLVRPLVAMIGWQEGLLILAIVAVVLLVVRMISAFFRNLATGGRESKKGIGEPVEEIEPTVTEAALTEDSSTE